MNWVVEVTDNLDKVEFFEIFREEEQAERVWWYLCRLGKKACIYRE